MGFSIPNLRCNNSILSFFPFYLYFGFPSSLEISCKKICGNTNKAKPTDVFLFLLVGVYIYIYITVWLYLFFPPDFSCRKKTKVFLGTRNLLGRRREMDQKGFFLCEVKNMYPYLSLTLSCLPSSSFFGSRAPSPCTSSFRLSFLFAVLVTLLRSSFRGRHVPVHLTEFNPTIPRRPFAFFRCPV